ncbi:MAG: lipid-A-disaccharide synthase [Pseudomonadota bacterium]|nr:lipid-A-disaccharide synthase [Pseudomonadota bacterium]
MNASAPLCIALVAGEASGDLLGSHLMSVLGKHLPNVRFIGIGGPKMQAAGQQILFPMEKLAVRGYVEVLRHYLEIIGIRRKLLALLLAEPPDIFIGIDAPDFNLDLELALKARGITTVHYVSPSIWAWRFERIDKIKQAVTKMLVLFPFEAPLYERAGVPVSYVGHPLADMLPENPDRNAARAELGVAADAIVIALLPGSRQSELRALADVFIRTAQSVANRKSGVHFLVPLASEETRDLFARAMQRRDTANLHLRVLEEQAHQAMIAADVVLVASGTATLEAALLKRPMVIAYKMPAISWWIMRRKAYLPYAGLPNILCQEFVVPEFLQQHATPYNLSRALLDLLNDEGARSRIARKFSELHGILRQNTAHKAAEAILPLLRI